jgi:putative chitinase
LSAAWFWATKGLNTLADADKFETITRRINGGLNGEADRLKLWAKALEVLA